MVSRPGIRRLIPLLGVALIASLAFGVSAAAAAPQYWYSCNKGFGGTQYSDSACTTEAAKGSYHWKMLSSAETAFTATNTTPFTWRWSQGYFEPYVAVTCSTQSSGKAGILNPSGGSNGVGNATLTFSGCAVTEPSGYSSRCKVEVPSVAYPINLGEYKGEPAATFSLGEGMEIRVTQVTGQPVCPIALGQHWVFTGSFTGVSRPATSSLEFTEASSSMTANKQPAYIKGTSKIETSAKEALKVGP